MATNLSRKDLDVAHHFDAARDCRTDDRLAERNARTRNDRIHAFHQRRVEGSERDRNAGMLEPQSGRVELNGRAGFLLQDPGRHVLRERAEDEVALGAGGDRARARRALAQMGLAGREAAHPRDLSSGERERLALASVLVTEPDLLVLDEPTRGVDPERKRELAALLRANTTRATLVVTHDRAFARAVADRVVSPVHNREPVHA